MNILRIEERVGARLRRRRKLLGLSLESAGALCGMGFRQLQKYELAANAMPAARLWRLATGLGVPVDYFFEGLSARAEAIPSPIDAAEPSIRVVFARLTSEQRKILLSFAAGADCRAEQPAASRPVAPPSPASATAHQGRDVVRSTRAFAPRAAADASGRLPRVT